MNMNMNILTYIYECVAYCPYCGAEQYESDDPGWIVVDGDHELADKLNGCCCGTCNHSLSCPAIDAGPCECGLGRDCVA